MIVTRASTICIVSFGLSALVSGCGAAADGPTVFGRGGTATGAGGSDVGSGGAGAADTVGGGGSSATGGSFVGNGGSGVIIPGGVGNGQGGGAINADAACVAQAQQGEARPITLLFMMDNSGSMDNTGNNLDPGQTLTRWQIISAAVPAFVNAPENAGLYAGLDFFPELLPGQGNNNNAQPTCVVTDYQNVNVPIGILPGLNNAQATAFGTAINTRMLGGGTPSTPALTGAVASASAWQTAHPEQNVSVVFVTDGEPNGCMSTVANAAMAAAAGFAATPSIKTYVLGVGTETGNLDTIAAAGGTGTAFLVTMDGANGLTVALNAIKGTALACDYKVPNLANQQLDYDQVNVQTRVGAQGNASLLQQVANVGACGVGDGWYYDLPLVPGGPSPTTITLCPNTCDPLKMTPGSTLQVLIGCKTVTRIQ